MADKYEEIIKYIDDVDDEDDVVDDSEEEEDAEERIAKAFVKSLNDFVFVPSHERNLPKNTKPPIEMSACYQKSQGHALELCPIKKYESIEEMMPEGISPQSSCESLQGVCVTLCFKNYIKQHFFHVKLCKAIKKVEPTSSSVDDIEDEAIALEEENTEQKMENDCEDFLLAKKGKMVFEFKKGGLAPIAEEEETVDEITDEEVVDVNSPKFFCFISRIGLIIAFNIGVLMIVVFAIYYRSIFDV